jgi:pimeloyl-ACP methyl ester carboxylesterase
MATFVLLPGAGSDSWYWHLVAPELRAAGAEVIAVDLPVDDDASGLAEYADVAVHAIGARTDLIVVAQSMGAFTAPLIATQVGIDLIVLVAGMVPTPGESPGEWWANTGQPEAMRRAAIREGRNPDNEFDPVEVFLHDVPEALAAESAAHVRNQSGTPFEAPWPLDEWPPVATRFLLCRRDRLFPADFQRRVVLERLGITPDEIDSGHLPALSVPQELAARLLAFRTDWEMTGR